MARLAAPVRRLGFDAGALTDWDSGLLTFVSGISKSCADRGITIDSSGLPPGAQRLLAETLEQQPDAIWRGNKQKSAP